MGLLEASPDLASGEFADRVLEAVSRWTERTSSEERDDDITLLVIRSNR